MQSFGFGISLLGFRLVSGVFLVHSRRNMIIGFFRVDERDLRLTQVYDHCSGMPFFDGFAFSGEELHNGFTLS